MYPVERMGKYNLERMTSGAHPEQQVVGVMESLQENELRRFDGDVKFTIDSYHSRMVSGTVVLVVVVVL